MVVDFKCFFCPNSFSGLVGCPFLLLQQVDLAAEEGDDLCVGGAGGRRRTDLGLWAPLCSGWFGGGRRTDLRRGRY